MTNRSKQRGTAFETSITDWLRTFYYPDAKRNPLAGAKDVGDIHLPGEKRFVLELKNVARLNLPGWVAEAQREAGNLAQQTVGVVVHKRHGKASPPVQWVTLELGDFMWLVNTLSEPSPRAFT